MNVVNVGPDRPRHATFRFYAQLRDFLRRESREQAYSFRGRPAVKDAIEAQGVPHPEVALILVNGDAVDFSHQLSGGERVSVYPEFSTLNPEPLKRLRPPLPDPVRFVLDVNLGKLARWLRLLGFDTLYRNDFDDADVVAIASREDRVVLTRDRRLLHHSDIVHGYWVRAVDPGKQVREVLQHFDLAPHIDPFHRCLKCNGSIAPVAKAAIVQQLLPKTRAHYEDFYQCIECEKVYWRGPHYARLLRDVQWIDPDHSALPPE